MNRPLRTATALVSSLALALPTLSLPLSAQQSGSGLTAVTAQSSCTDQLGSEDAEALRDCVADALEAGGQADVAAQIRAGADPAAVQAAVEPAPEAEAEVVEEPVAEETVAEIPAGEVPAEEDTAEEAVETEATAQDAPVTEDPAAEALVADEAATDEAATGEPATEEPAVEALVAETPAEEVTDTEETVAEVPTADAPLDDAPAAEVPLIVAPVAEATSAETPAVAAEAPAAAATGITEDVARQACSEQLGDDAGAVQDCVAFALEADGQTDLAAQIRARPVEQEADAAPASTAEEAPVAEAPAAKALVEDAPAAVTPDVETPAAEVPAAPAATAEAVPAETAAPETAGTEAATTEAATTEAEAPESEAADEVAARGEPELTAEQQAAAEQASAALASTDTGTPSAAAAAAEGEGGTVTEQTVTQEDVRTSGQDFATGAVVTQTDDDDDGLSNRQKFALGALGVLAVGTLLNNRNRVVSNSGDRVIVQREDGQLQVLKDDDTLLRQPGSDVRTERFDDGSTRTTVSRQDGSQVVTIRDASLRVLRRTLVQQDGQRFVLIDDTVVSTPVDVANLPRATPVLSSRTGAADPLRAALEQQASGVDRRFTLEQVRTISEVRALAPALEVGAVTFATGSAAITPEQAANLTGLAREVLAKIQADPRQVFLIEGHTDAVGDAAYNLALSDRRAETLALALNEYFGVPVENMVVQGYGERFLLVQTQTAEAANRRATVRNITTLLQTAAAN